MYFMNVLIHKPTNYDPGLHTTKETGQRQATYYKKFSLIYQIQNVKLHS